MFVRQKINNPQWANLIETFILTRYIWKLQQKKQKFVTWKNPTSGYPCLPSLVPGIILLQGKKQVRKILLVRDESILLWEQIAHGFYHINSSYFQISMLA